ncbi:MAG: polyprenyl synthetase family protein [Myxococcales bacterium]|nr:polyprenyl synthetase family protein [Myxococcales bacterium]
MSQATKTIVRGLDRLLDWVPSGVELNHLRALVADDLVGDEALAEVVGPRFEVGRTQIPRVRPILVALAARASGADSVDQEAQHAAELLHLALRVHDLALGREGGRRRRVARRLVRRSMGWLTGNYLTLRALELSRHSEPGVLEELMDALRSFSDAQVLSRELVGELPEEEDWLEHADAHTGALFAFCCRAGGLIGGASTRQVAALGRFGRHLGRMWHVAEDVSVLDHGEPALHLLARAAAGRPVLPVICAAERDGAVAEDWRRLTTEADPDCARSLAHRVRQVGVGPSREVMIRESWRARKALAALSQSRYRTAMDRFAGELARAVVPKT